MLSIAECTLHHVVCAIHNALSCAVTRSLARYAMVCVSWHGKHAAHSFLAGCAPDTFVHIALRVTPSGCLLILHRCRRIDDVHMNVVVLTNLAREHLEDGERMEDYVSVAASLFARLDDPDTQRAVINVDGVRCRHPATVCPGPMCTPDRSIAASQA